jgi:CMP-N,N'-diacetyllegionaminic acid synthase
MSVACIIPVRRGSKGIAHKNLSPLVGNVTLLDWTIDQALRCFAPNEVLVSTEDKELAAAAGGRGAQVIPRPNHLAQDHSTTASVVEDLLQSLDPDATRFHQILILQVTSPLRQDDDVAAARELIDSGRFDSVISGFAVKEHHPAKMYFMDGTMARPVSPDFETARRQDLPPVCRRNGAIFWTTRDWFGKTGQLWGGRTGLVVMPHERSVDIDAPEDLAAAQDYLLRSQGMKRI